MHEMSLCEGILQIVEDSARKAGASRITAVTLEIGRFSGVEVSALRFCFDVVIRGTLAEGAALEVIDVQGQAFCFDCSTSVAIDDRLAPCPLCGGGRLMPSGGDEMRVRDIAVS